jgi:hypothetical protein
VRGYQSILNARCGVGVIFHAAALKPSLASSSTAITLRNPLPTEHVAASPVRGQPRIRFLAVDLGGLDLAVAPLGVSLNSRALRPITNGFIAHSAGLLSMGKKPAST